MNNSANTRGRDLAVVAESIIQECKHQIISSLNRPLLESKSVLNQSTSFCEEVALSILSLFQIEELV